VPELLERPEIEPWNLPMWRAWCYLSGSRRAAFGGAMPIPVSEVEAYLRLRYPDFDVEERMEFLEVISRLDRVYMDHQADQAKQDNDEKGETESDEVN
jgi:hypothetical protein